MVSGAAGGKAVTRIIYHYADCYAKRRGFREQEEQAKNDSAVSCGGASYAVSVFMNAMRSG